MDSFATLTPKEWFEFGFLVVGALGSIATLFAFLFLFKKDKDKQEQINRLAGIAEALKKQNETLQMQLYQDKDNTRLQFLPSLKIKKRIETSNASGFILLVANYGKPARILMVKHQSKYIDHTPTSKVPCDCT